MIGRKEAQTAPFPPGKGGGEDVEYGYKGKGVTTHLLTEGNGMPLSAVSTGAAGDERDQVASLFNKVRVYHGFGRPRRYTKELHADKGYDAKILRVFLRSKGVRPVIPRRVWKARKRLPGLKPPISKDRWKVERCFAWMQRKFRRLVVRWERRRKYWEGFILLGIIMMWVEKLICG